MKYAIIAPIPHLKVALLSDIHLVEAPLVLRSDAYREFYRERSDAGDYIILDNGTALLSVATPVEMLLEAAELVPPSEVVVPDAWLDARQTITSYLMHIGRLREALPDAKFMAVAQGETLGDWFLCWDVFMRDERVDVIGLPKNMSSPNGPFSWPQHRGGRGFVARAIDTMLSDVKKPHHLLGLWGTPGELWKLRQFSWIRSIDTSFASVCAQHGTHLVVDDSILWSVEKPAQSLDFFSGAGSRELHLRNAERFIDLVRSSQ